MRLPELEAQKKAAASAKEFKEAARLSAEAKEVVSKGEKASEEAASLAREIEQVTAVALRLRAAAGRSQTSRGGTELKEHERGQRGRSLVISICLASAFFGRRIFVSSPFENDTVLLLP